MSSRPITQQDSGTDVPPKRKKVSTHWLYVAVIVAVVAAPRSA